MAILSLAGAGFVLRGPRLKVSQLAALRRPGLAGAFAYGFVFGLGTSVTPLLLLLTVAAAKGSSAQGLPLAFPFGVGRGFPFLLAGVIGSAITAFARLGSSHRYRDPERLCLLLSQRVLRAGVQGAPLVKRRYPDEYHNHR